MNKIRGNNNIQGEQSEPLTIWPFAVLVDQAVRAVRVSCCNAVGSMVNPHLENTFELGGQPAARRIMNEQPSRRTCNTRRMSLHHVTPSLQLSGHVRLLTANLP